MNEKEIFDRDIIIFNLQNTDGDSISVSGQFLVKHVLLDLLTRTG